MAPRPRTVNLVRIAGVAAAAVVGLWALTGCGGTSKVSSASLMSRLAPESVAPGFHLQRTLDWSNPANLVGEGIHLPERTHPSQAINEINGAGFEGAVGEQLNQGGPTGQTVTSGVMKFQSAADAQKVRDWMHGQDLQQPCFAQCIFSPLNLAIPSVPGAVGVKQVPVGAAAGPVGPSPKVLAALRRQGITPPTPPPGATNGPPTNYFVEFAIGPYVYFASVNGGTQGQFIAGAKQYYDSVRRLRAS
jgi:hypothetical protein